jgi:hypothetical protein
MKKNLTSLVLSIILITSLAFKSKEKLEFNSKLTAYCEAIPSNFNDIPSERKSELKEIANFILEQKKQHLPSNLLFVCTSNSRRSHMAQVWAQIASYYYGIDSVFTFSGGTEQTRVNINAIEAFQRAGIEIYSNNQGDNPLRYVRIGDKWNPWVIFSKKFTDATNPKTNFAAIMVCAEADKACPFVEGADLRIGLPYQDPKEFDNSPLEDTKYDERCKQIATEMFFVMDIVSKSK